ncbi:hypothetical protein ACF0PP_24110, partial [Pseudomonas aeruginosa]|uniref:hypothetical protein n=1 Tax=Pseudomonas aeruginosa TaxID=287 RepID=UPI0036F8EF86
AGECLGPEIGGHLALFVCALHGWIALPLGFLSVVGVVANFCRDPARLARFDGYVTQLADR